MKIQFETVLSKNTCIFLNYIRDEEDPSPIHQVLSTIGWERSYKAIEYKSGSVTMVDEYWHGPPGTLLFGYWTNKERRSHIDSAAAILATIGYTDIPSVYFDSVD